MKLKINPEAPEEGKIKIAVKALKEGKTVLYPTDTVYGIGTNIFNLEAVEKIYKIKKRPLNKPISVCVSSINDLHKIAYLNKDMEKKLEHIFPGPFTVILKKKNIVPPILTAGSEKIGIRIPDSKICMELSSEFPITTTSANISGKTVAESVEGVLEQLEDGIDLILDAGICRHRIHSTVIDMTVSPPQILRKGLKMPHFI
ncbi:MAG: L-threonylcarbamoyladenylate synthase [Methanobacterium sp.]